MTNKYKSKMDQELQASAIPLLQQHHGRHRSWKYDTISKIWLCQSMHIYLKNNPAEFHPDLIQNVEALGSPRQQQQQNE